MAIGLSTFKMLIMRFFFLLTVLALCEGKDYTSRQICLSLSSYYLDFGQRLAYYQYQSHYIQEWASNNYSPVV